MEVIIILWDDLEMLMAVGSGLKGRDTVYAQLDKDTL